MIPTLLITLREVVEASLIVATMLGILTKLGQKKNIKTVWLGAVSALFVSFLLVLGGSMIGVNVQKVFGGPIFEGSVYVVSAFFVTWAVFFLHSHFAREKMQFLSQIRATVARDGIFAFTFMAVLREGIEITLFLSTLYLTNTPFSILTGFGIGMLLGILISFLFFRATLRLPVYYAFRVTSFLLIFFAGGLLSQGVKELLEFMPPLYVSGTQTLPAVASLTYIFLMHRRVFVRSSGNTRAPGGRDRGFLSVRGNRC